MFSCRLDTPVENPFLFRKSFMLRVLCHSLHLCEAKEQKIGASERVSTPAGFTSVVHLVRLSCLFRICYVQNEPNVVLRAVCRLIPGRVKAVCPESGSGLLGLFCCWLFSYLIITVQVFNFQTTNQFHLH